MTVGAGKCYGINMMETSKVKRVKVRKQWQGGDLVVLHNVQ